MDECSIAHEVYEKMLHNHNLAGSYKEADGHIIWHLFHGYTLDITSEYIGINKVSYGNVSGSIYHWHPDDEDLYDEVCRLGTRGNVTVIRLFGLGGMLGSSLIYCGPGSDRPIRRKRLFGKYVYLYAE